MPMQFYIRTLKLTVYHIYDNTVNYHNPGNILWMSIFELCPSTRKINSSRSRGKLILRFPKCSYSKSIHKSACGSRINSKPISFSSPVKSRSAFIIEKLKLKCVRILPGEITSLPSITFDDRLVAWPKYYIKRHIKVKLSLSLSLSLSICLSIYQPNKHRVVPRTVPYLDGRLHTTSILLRTLNFYQKTLLLLDWTFFLE